MNTAEGDIWTLSTKHDAVVIAMNVGWKGETRKGVLGAGLARDAARRFPWLAQAWGEYCFARREETEPIAWLVESKWCRYLIAFPTKAFDAAKPWLSWRADSSLELIAASLPLLQTLAVGLVADAVAHEKPKPIILVPSLGCGHGNLQEKDVLPLMKTHLVHPCFTHVRKS